MALIYITHNWMRSGYTDQDQTDSLIYEMPRVEWKVKSIKIFYFPCSLFRDTPWLTNHHLMTEEYKHSLRVAAANIVCHQELGPETTRTLGIS